METITTSLVTLVVGGFLGGLVKSALDYRSHVFSDLWDKRFNAYKELWRIMGQIPRWPRLDDVSYSKLFEMSKRMRDWYFNNGGLLMSEKTRKKYGDVQEEINDRVIKNKENNDSLIGDEEYDKIQDLCSVLRGEMTKDLLSRKKQI